jgi:hypothetical protein
LLRTKKYLGNVEYNRLNGYAGLYLGNLKRTIQSSGYVNNTGWFGYPGRDFAANSVRGGGSLGIIFIAKNKIIIDMMGSMGYGKYTQYYKPDKSSKAYFDAQVWFSVGYCF